MMQGTVTENREIEIPLAILDADQVATSFAAVLDTGFNGELSLPLSALHQANSMAAGTRRVELGNGNVVELDVHLVSIIWHDKPRDVLALHAETTPLIGMSLLWGSRVTIDCRSDGVVDVSEA